MLQTTRRFAPGPALAAALLLSLVACKAATTSPQGGGLSLAISPAAPSVVVSQTVQFSATLGGGAVAVNWKVEEASGCGTVNGAGLYTAPAAPTTCHVTATSQADVTLTRTVTVSITAVPVVTVTVSPDTASVQTGATRQFSATVTGTSNTAVTWSVQEASGCGSVSGTGLYTAPGSATTCHVVATSVVSSSAQGSATVTVTLAPVVVTVSPGQNVIQSAGTAQFQAIVTGAADATVTWSVPDCGSVSATGLYTAPTVTVTTTCHAVATSNADVTRSGSAVITVLAPGGGSGNRLGINVGAPMVWDASRVYADGMRQGIIENVAALDANGWPLSATFTVLAASDLRYSNGTWTVYFDGTASVSGKTINGPGGTGPDGLPLGPNTRWFTHVVTSTGGVSVSFNFTGAARNDGSGLAGLTNIKVMRPSAQGSAASNRRDETIDRQVKSLTQRFGTVRYMDFLATNWSQVTTWGGYPWHPGQAYAVGDQVTTCTSANVSARSCGKVLQATVAGTSSTTASAVPDTATWGGTVTDGTVTWRWVGWGRPLPTWSGFDRDEGNGSGDTASTGGNFGWQGIGGPYEDIIKFSNESGTDAWINLPAQVDDDYITKVAQLFAFGSDGAMPYTSPQANPVYPPLSPALNLYIEYSNEVWLAGGFSQNTYVNAQASAAGLLQYQYVGRQVAKISTAFRAAFGDSQMPATGNGRIRPVVMGQGASQDQTAGHALKWIHEFLGDGNGVDHSAARVAAGFASAPHPIRYYVHGSGGAPYWSGSGATAATVLTSMTVSGIHNGYLAKMNRHAAIYGLPMLAYEGGPELPQSAIGTTANMTDQPATPNMRDVMVTNHTNWSASGGDLFIYFTLATDPRWCFVFDDGYRGNIYADSPKLFAIDALRATAPAPVTLSSATFQNGTAIPGTAPGGAYAVGYSDSTFAPAGGGTGSASLSGTSAWTNSKGWVFLAPDTATRTVSAALSGGGTVRCFVDGVQLGADQAATGTVQCGSLSLAPGLHGVILTAVAGSVTVASVTVQ